VKLKMKVRMLPCPRCGGAHASWWSTSSALPPSCDERRLRLMARKLDAPAR
jgi:hypothetical protein